MHSCGVKFLGVHFRWVEHNVVRCAVPENVSPQMLLHILWRPRVPVCNILHVHELETLMKRSIGYRFVTRVFERSHLTNLDEKCDKLAECFERRIIEGA